MILLFEILGTFYALTNLEHVQFCNLFLVFDDRIHLVDYLTFLFFLLFTVLLALLFSHWIQCSFNLYFFNVFLRCVC